MRIVIDIRRKGWVKGLGLHHLIAPMITIFIAHFISIQVARFVAIFWVGWYARHEYGWGPRPPSYFEIMDFLSPALLGAAYLYWSN